MQSIRIALAVATLTTASLANAFVTPMPAQTAASTLTRAEVVAETRRAVAAGEIAHDSFVSNTIAKAQSTRDVAAVRAEARASLKQSAAQAVQNRVQNGV